ncbi:MAG: tRNA (cytidine(34)-2'-O)-methyltransferase [Gammaproteobacteria bacterium]|nr:tRNA (cytidine(34)-2'-O)-methyltransferase [Gammaproteobacteria bacterium]
MFNIVLFEPEIPPNTGNIIRLVANTGCRLHLIEPMGFELDDKLLRRAGLDYREWAEVCRYRSFKDYIKLININQLYAFTTKAGRTYTEAEFQPQDSLLFGPESRGLPVEILSSLGSDNKLRIPMADNSRSLNLSNTVAIAVYEAWRQQGFN